MFFFSISHILSRVVRYCARDKVSVTEVVTALEKCLEKRERANQPTVYVFSKKLVAGISIAPVYNALLSDFLYLNRLHTARLGTDGVIYLSLPNEPKNAEPLTIVMGVSEMRFSVPLSRMKDRNWDDIARALVPCLLLLKGVDAKK